MAVLALEASDAELAFETASDTTDAGAWSRLADAGRSALRARAALSGGQEAEKR
jgi:hypothetical protein